MLNKRGQGLSTNAIILIVLGVVVLAVLIAGFMLGWGNLKDKIAPSNNVKAVVDACSVACNTQSQYDYCTVQRNLKDDAGNEVTTSCNELSKSYLQYGVGGCSSVSCTISTKIYDNEADAKTGCTTIKGTLKYKVDIKQESYSCKQEDLAKDVVGAKLRCSKAGQEVNWEKTNGDKVTVEKITCTGVGK